MKKFLASVLISSTLLIGCKRDSQVVSHNLSEKADKFEILRRIVFYNGITDDYILSIEGFCSIRKDRSDAQLEVTCKTNTGYKKHFLGISDNVTYFAEQIDSEKVSKTFYKVIFKPLSIIPDVDVE